MTIYILRSKQFRNDLRSKDLMGGNMAGNTFIGFLQQEVTQKASNIQRRREEDKVHHTGPINIIEPLFSHKKKRNMEKLQAGMNAFVINIFPSLIPAGHKPSGPSGI